MICMLSLYKASYITNSCFVLVAVLLSVSLIPTTASATMLGPCDYLNSWSTLRVGDKDTNISDIGSIAGLQQMIGERDLMNQGLDASGKGGFISGTFDEETRNILISWQMKHGAITSRSDAEAGVVGEKTLAVAKNYCGGATNARGDLVMSGPTITYTLYFPQKGSGPDSFGSITSSPMPKYTSRVADQVLRTLFDSSPYGGAAPCKNPEISGNCWIALDGREFEEGSPGFMFSPFNSYELAKNGYQAKDINGNDVYLRNGYRGITLENGVATVSFNQIGFPFFDNAAVSPLVRGSIERTLKQFPTISQVRYKVISFNDAAPPSERIFEGSNPSGQTDATSKIASLLAQLKTLQDLIAKLSGGTNATQQPGSPSSYIDYDSRGKECLTLTRNLWIGKGDAETDGEVSKLQQFLVNAGLYPEAIVSGYYGQATARAVVRWQKAHGMDFVTTKSGIGPMTRERMKVCGVWGVEAGG